MPESYACLPGRGTHRAVLAFHRGIRSYPWVVRQDIRRYFLEIDWNVLTDILFRVVRDPPCRRLLTRVIESGSGLYTDPATQEVLGVRGVYRSALHKGLPIGSLTSQLFANVYLDGFDHFVKRELRVPAYVRYMDDFAIFVRDRKTARDVARAAAVWLAEHRRLEIHPEGLRRGCPSFR